MGVSYGYVYLGKNNKANDPEVAYLRKQIVEGVAVIEDKEKLDQPLAGLEGGPDIVLNLDMDWENLDEEDMKAFAEADEDIKAGRVYDAREHLAELRAKYLRE